MPAYLGNNFNIAGIKWIASFPDNINNGIPRAHSVLILNNANTGIPACIINTPLLSVIRTASVSGSILKKYLDIRKKENLKVGIIGFGPIGQYHYKMCKSLIKNCDVQYLIYDLKPIRDVIKKDKLYEQNRGKKLFAILISL
jgi:ornithine cyclodeaminase